MFKRAAALIFGLATSALLSVGIFMPAGIVFAGGGLDLVIRLDFATGSTNQLASIEFADATGGIVVRGTGGTHVMGA